ncbi:MAG: DUF5357 family protein [Limnoraphis robusta]|uniref:DUF5357 family protein n=1 Tax=Limnoraphis robusta TaxID=1118279 RepID=UPI002B20007E|nr:DUF5357 family protein [Limnoraphis robusta]MEA5540181.1 DUF5357 family protein [Limnoraphis robusta Tam1]
MTWKTNIDRFRTVVNPVMPPRFIHWKTLLLVSIVIWGLSFIATDYNQETIAAIGWILLTISLGWRASQPPFIFGSFPLSPWLIATLISLLIYQRTDETEPTLALKVWPVIAAILLVVVEWLKSRNPEKSPPLLGRKILLIIILIHLLLSCWIEIYLLIFQQSENSPYLNPNRTLPRAAFQVPLSESILLDAQFKEQIF